MPEKQPSVARRRIVSGLAAAAVLPNRRVRAQSSALNFATYGGAYGEAVNTHFVKAFEKESAVRVTQSVNQTLAPVRIQVLSNNVQFDLVELAGSDFHAGLRQNLFEPVDTSIVKLNNVPAFARHEYGIEYALFLSGIGYDRRRIRDADAPGNWADAWDVNKYKGPRGLSKHLADAATLEAALLADGVPIDGLYPLDVDRAFDSLKRLGLGNIVWFEGSQEPVDFINRQLGPIAQIASGRAVIANSKGARIGFVYEQLQLSGDYLAVPKGAKNREAAFRLIDFVLNDDQAAVNWMTETAYAIANEKAMAMMPPDVASRLPTHPAMRGKYFQKDFRWWADNATAVLARLQRLIAA